MFEYGKRRISMKKFLSMLVFIIMLGSMTAFAADDNTGVSQNVLTKNIFIEGRIDKELMSKQQDTQIVLLMIDKNADINSTSLNDIKYIEQFAVRRDGTYSIKFRYSQNAADTRMYLKFGGQIINNSIVSAVYTAQMMSGDVLLTDNDGRAYDAGKADGSMPEYTYSRVIDGTEYTHKFKEDFEIPERKGLNAYVRLKNKYGMADEKFTVILACYDNQNRLIACYPKEKTAAYGDDGKEQDFYTEAFGVPSGTSCARAYVYGSLTNLIPYTEGSDGSLEDVTVFCVGDSTGQDWQADSYPQAGWGTFIKDYFNPEHTTFVNNCESGAWAQAILDNDTGNPRKYGNGKWKKTIGAAKPGDYIIVSLGINDANKYGPNGELPEEWYAAGLKQMIKEAKENGINIIMCTPIHSGDKIVETGKKLDMIAMMKKVCRENDVEFLDIFSNIENRFIEIDDISKIRSKYFLERKTLAEAPSEDGFGFGLSEAEILNHTNSYIKNADLSDEKAVDYTHTNVRGANLTCHAIAEELKKSESELKFYLK